jgi:hypothetical protein
VFCPDCGGEFVEGVGLCPDCGAELGEALPERAQAPRPRSAAGAGERTERDFVCIGSFANSAELALAKSVLAARGISVTTQGESAAALYARVLRAHLYVPQAELREAEELLRGIDLVPEIP